MLSLLKKFNAHFQIKSRFISFSTTFFSKLFCLNKSNRWTTTILENMLENETSVSDSDRSMRYTTINKMTLMRVDSLFEKEPQTIRWLKSMKAGEVLYDIGANVGMYSIYPGVKGVRVLSFEPEASNYFILNKNIQKNKLSHTVKAYNIALADTEGFSELKLSSTVIGSAHTTFGDNEKYKIVNDPTIFEQGCFGTTLDQLLSKYGFPVPQHVKIDVDGIEAKIIKGGTKFFHEPGIKTVLIELNEDLEEDRWVKSFLLSCGFKEHSKTDPYPALIKNTHLREYIFSR